MYWRFGKFKLTFVPSQGTNYRGNLGVAFTRDPIQFIEATNTIDPSQKQALGTTPSFQTTFYDGCSVICHPDGVWKRSNRSLYDALSGATTNEDPGIAAWMEEIFDGRVVAVTTGISFGATTGTLSSGIIGSLWMTGTCQFAGPFYGNNLVALGTRTPTNPSVGPYRMFDPCGRKWHKTSDRKKRHGISHSQKRYADLRPSSPIPHDKFLGDDSKEQAPTRKPPHSLKISPKHESWEDDC